MVSSVEVETTLRDVTHLVATESVEAGAGLKLAVDGEDAAVIVVERRHPVRREEGQREAEKGFEAWAHLTLTVLRVTSARWTFTKGMVSSGAMDPSVTFKEADDQPALSRATPNPTHDADPIKAGLGLVDGGPLLAGWERRRSARRLERRRERERLTSHVVADGRPVSRDERRAEVWRAVWLGARLERDRRGRANEKESAESDGGREGEHSEELSDSGRGGATC